MNASRVRKLRALLMVTVVFASMMMPVSGAQATHGLGNFEIDGNRADLPAGGLLDWDSPLVASKATVFPDANDGTDDSFVGGSKELEPGSWNCSEAHSVPDKSDLTEGGLFFRQAPDGDQFLHGYWLRDTTNGSVHIDYELNQSLALNPACNSMPLRTDDDLLLAFDFGGTKSDLPTIRLFKWAFAENSTTTGSFTQVTAGSAVWEAQVNEKSEMGFPLGKFGEFTFNLTDSQIGSITCGQFGASHLKSRASTEISAALKDKTSAETFDGPCPKPAFDKQVRNVSNGEQSFKNETLADPGDVLEYRLLYENNGEGNAYDVVLQDTVQPRSTLLTPSPCDALPVGSCTFTGVTPGNKVTWDFDTVPPGGQRTALMRVKLASVFPAGTTPVENTATAETWNSPPGDERDPGDLERQSDSSTVAVGAGPQITIDKEASSETSAVGETVKYSLKVTNLGNADGVTTVEDDYDETHVDVENISDGGQNSVPGDVITWTAVAVPAGQSKTLSYDATFKGPFTSGGGTEGCSSEPTRFPVENTATASGATDSETVCVAAEPKFAVTKTAASTSVLKGESTTYTINVENTGDAPGSTPVTDDYDQDHIIVDDDSHTGVNDGDTITWDSGVLAPGESVTFTYSALFGGEPVGSGTLDCPAEQFPVINTVTVEGDEATVIVCETPEPAFIVNKTALPKTAHVGESVKYTIQVTNVSGATATTDVVDDYDQNHLAVDESSISDGGQNSVPGDVIRWLSVTLENNESRIFSYTGTIKGPFDGTPTEGCQGANVYPVINTVVVTGDSDKETVCVPASPDLQITKTGVVETPQGDREKITSGDVIIYTLAYTNNSNADATDVKIADDFPESVEFVSCSDDCTTEGSPVGKVTWNVGTVPAGGGGSLTLTVRVIDDAEKLEKLGCSVCNTSVITSAQNSSDQSEPFCKAVVLDPSADLVNAHGKAVGAKVFVGKWDKNGTSDTSDDTVETIKNVELLGAASNSNDPDGGGQDGQAESQEPVAVSLLPGGDELLLSADALYSFANSVIGTTQASQLSVAEVQGMELLSHVLTEGQEGIIKSNLVRAVAKTLSNSGGGSGDTIGSTIADLHLFLDLDGEGGADPLLNETISEAGPHRVDLEDPNKTVEEGDLLEPIFGAGSYIQIVPGATDPTTAPANQFVNAHASMFELHITRLAPVDLKIDLVLTDADANSKFPPHDVCPGAEGVRARAFALEANAIDQPTQRALETFIPQVGGTSHEAVAEASIGSPSVDELGVPATAIASASNVVSHSSGSVDFGSNTSHANSYLAAEYVCLLPDGVGGCAVRADLVRSESTSDATLNGAVSATDQGTTLGALFVGGEEILLQDLDPDPNSQVLPVDQEIIEIPNVGFLVLNEQTHSCEASPLEPVTAGSMACGSGEKVRRTVTLLHLFVTNPGVAQLGGSPVVEIKAVSADSGAVFK